MTEAKKEQEAHQTAFQELHKALAPETTEAWTAEVKSWEENPNDPSVANPFESKVVGESRTKSDCEELLTTSIISCYTSCHSAQTHSARGI